MCRHVMGESAWSVSAEHRLRDESRGSLTLHEEYLVRIGCPHISSEAAALRR